MDSTLVAGIIGASATVSGTLITILVKNRELARVFTEYGAYRAAVSHHESYLDVDYGIAIIAPKDDERVGRDVQVSGVYSIMPPPGTLRLYVQRLALVHRDELYWPQEVVTNFSPTTKTWQAHVNIGGDASDGTWGILAAIVGPSAIVLWDYYYKVGPKTEWCGFEKWPSDARECNRVRVRRA